jgi:hypothetical protein
MKGLMDCLCRFEGNEWELGGGRLTGLYSCRRFTDKLDIATLQGCWVSLSSLLNYTREHEVMTLIDVWFARSNNLPLILS